MRKSKDCHQCHGRTFVYNDNTDLWALLCLPSFWPTWLFIFLCRVLDFSKGIKETRWYKIFNICFPGASNCSLRWVTICHWYWTIKATTGAKRPAILFSSEHQSLLYSCEESQEKTKQTRSWNTETDQEFIFCFLKKKNSGNCEQVAGKRKRKKEKNTNQTETDRRKVTLPYLSNKIIGMKTCINKPVNMWSEWMNNEFRCKEITVSSIPIWCLKPF